MVIGLIRPDSKMQNYQNLTSLSAIEPPHWMACRVKDLQRLHDDVIIWDAQVDEVSPDMSGCDEIEIWATGVHPSAWIQEQAGVDRLKLKTTNVTIIDHLPFDAKKVSPDWSLFNMNKYHAHNWQTWGSKQTLAPYGTVHTSVSCPYKCKFCTIHSYYGTKYATRYIESVVNDLNVLSNSGVKNVKVMDELFLTKKSGDLLKAIINETENNFNIWGYSRVDTLPDNLGIVKTAGVNWICLGIESGNQEIRQSMNKGKFTNEDIRNSVTRLKDAGISVLGNFMFGFPDDTFSTMQETLDLAIELNCEYSNFYCVVPYPGTELESYAKEQKWELPKEPSQYAQYSYDFLPLPTKYLTAKEVLKFRDTAWLKYHKNTEYLQMVLRKFGMDVLKEINEMTSRKLERKLLP